MVKPVGYYNFYMKLEKAFRFIESHREQDILIRSGTAENLQKKYELWNYLKENDRRTY